MASSCYQICPQSKVPVDICLQSNTTERHHTERTLSDYTHWTTPHTGISLEFIEELVKMLDDVPSGHNLCAISIDEMKIKSGLVFDKHSGTLVGFVDLGEVNRDIELLTKTENNLQSRFCFYGTSNFQAITNYALWPITLVLILKV